MKNELDSQDLFEVEDSEERLIVNSALWAAAGDALGWITELSHGPKGVVRRIGQDRVERPSDWRRRIGGRTGPTVDIPAGTYSDDTQLRLAVCRSIRGDRYFDVEAFAKVELTVWPVYALGAGLGTKTAAANLARRQVNWFSNFFERGKQRYMDCGGNGAAMRIQPHVWVGHRNHESMVLDVLKDALTTHGHPHGFCGAVWHAICLADVLRTKARPSLQDLHDVVEAFRGIDRIVHSDSQLSMFWKGYWEGLNGKSLEGEIAEMCDEISLDLDLMEREFANGASDPAQTYHRVLAALGCLEPSLRGSGMKTAIAASALSILFSETQIEECLLTAANELDSDTDTIATMAGALLGVIAEREPSWKLQDRSYIEFEAKRLAAVSRGEEQESFAYPNLSTWNPPVRHNAGVGMVNCSMALAGLGEVKELGREYATKDAVWKWLELPFGQTVLAKTKRGARVAIASSQMPAKQKLPHSAKEQVSSKHKDSGLDALEQNYRDEEPTLGFNDSENLGSTIEIAIEEPDPTSAPPTNFDSLLNEVVASNFDPEVLGRAVIYCIERFQSEEEAVSFTKSIANEMLARQRQSGKTTKKSVRNRDNRY